MTPKTTLRYIERKNILLRTRVSSMQHGRWNTGIRTRIEGLIDRIYCRYFESWRCHNWGTRKRSIRPAPGLYFCKGRIQPISATLGFILWSIPIAWEKTSQGVLYPKHFLGRLFIKSVALNSSFSVTLCKGIFFGKNCLSKPLCQMIIWHSSHAPKSDTV